MSGLSVVIPFAGSDSFSHTVRSLCSQTLNPRLFDVIVVAESDRKSAVAAINSVSTYSRRPVFTIVDYVRPSGFKGHSAGRMRNTGSRHAKHDIIAFIDSDAILEPRCLQEHLRLHRIDKNHVICGGWYELPLHQHHLLTADTQGFERLFAQTLPDYRSVGCKPDDWENLYSGNVSVPRKMFLRANGFDESGHRCHDIDLGYRLLRIGASFRYSPECRAIHIEHPRSVVTRKEQANGWKHLGKRFPEIQAHAEDRALMLMRSFHRTVDQCEQQFRQLVSDMPGVRSGNTWIVPPWCSSDSVSSALREIPHLAVEREFHRQRILRLDRNCWDYHIIEPVSSVLTNPSVSVLITTSNSEHSVGRAIDSVLVQTFQSFELIVVDDASSDETEHLIRSYSEDGRIRVAVNPTNRGLARSLNRALEMARAEIVVQLDADDWLEPGALEQIVKRFRSNPSLGGVYARAIVHEGDKSRKQNGYSVKSDTDLLTYTSVQAPRAYRTRILKRLGGWSIQDVFDGRFFEDRLTLARVQRIAPTSFVNLPLYHVDSSTDSLSRRDPYRTALAKFLILSSEANALRMHLETTSRASGITAHFVKRPNPVRKMKWSVIIPAHGRIELLRYALRSWSESDALTASGDSELIVVDDGSEIPIADLLRCEYPEVRFIRLPKRHGPAYARNIGASRARYRMIFFSDADRVVPPDVLGSHELRHRGSRLPSVVVGGLFGRKAATYLEPATIDKRLLRKLLEQFRFDSSRFLSLATAAQFGGAVDLIDQSDRRPLWKIIESLSFADPYLAGWGRQVLRCGDAEKGSLGFLRLGTGNISMSLNTFKKVGGFDTAAQPMEDWEFGARCEVVNVPIVTAAEIESYHQLHPPDQFLQRQHRRSMDRFRRKHPKVIQTVLECHEGNEVPGVNFIRNRVSGRFKSVQSAKPAQRLTPYCSLTFDDGPHSVSTMRILELLNLFGFTATFFVILSDAVKHPTIVQAIARSGSELGIHGWQHRPVTEQTTREIASELGLCIETLSEICGVRPRYCRPPYGVTSASYAAAAKEMNLQPIGWHFSPRDWAAQPASDLIADIATTNILGKVILLHDGSGDMDALIRTLDWLLRSAKKHGVSITTLSQLSRYVPLPQLGEENT